MALRGERQDDGFKPYGRDLASSVFYFAELTKARALLETMAGSARKYDEPEIPSEIKNRGSYSKGAFIHRRRTGRQPIQRRGCFQKAFREKKSLIES